MWPPLLVAVFVVLALRLHLSSHGHLLGISVLIAFSHMDTATGTQTHPTGPILTSFICKDPFSEKGPI